MKHQVDVVQSQGTAFGRQLGLFGQYVEVEAEPVPGHQGVLFRGGGSPLDELTDESLEVVQAHLVCDGTVGVPGMKGTGLGPSGGVKCDAGDSEGPVDPPIGAGREGFDGFDVEGDISSFCGVRHVWRVNSSQVCMIPVRNQLRYSSQLPRSNIR